MPPEYGTVAGVFDLYPRMGSVSVVTSALVESYINGSEAWIHGQIAHRYTIPLSGAPPILKLIAETRAAWMVLRRFFTQEKENTSEWVEGWKTDTEEMLEPYATGSATLVASDGTLLSPSLATPVPWSSTQQYKPTFDMRDPTAQRIDPDRVQADEDLDT